MGLEEGAEIGVALGHPGSLVEQGPRVQERGEIDADAGGPERVHRLGAGFEVSGLHGGVAEEVQGFGQAQPQRHPLLPGGGARWRAPRPQGFFGS